MEFWNQRKMETKALRLLTTTNNKLSAKDDMSLKSHSERDSCAAVPSLTRSSTSHPNLRSISELHEDEHQYDSELASNPLASMQYSVASDASALDSFRNANLQRASTMNFLGQLNLITSIDTKAAASKDKQKRTLWV